MKPDLHFWHVLCFYGALFPFSQTPGHYWKSVSTPTPSVDGTLVRKYVNNMKEYVALEIGRAKWGASRHIYFPLNKGLELGKISSSLHIGSGAWKNFELHPLHRLLDLEERSTSETRWESSYLSFSLCKVPGTWKNSKLSPLWTLALYIASGTRKNSKLHLLYLYRLRDMKERSEVRVVVYSFLPV